jgi:hypothetical protein
MAEMTGSGFNRQTFGTLGLHYSEWISEASQSGNNAECRARAEAVMTWLRQQRRIAPTDVQNAIDVTIAQVTAMVANYPMPARIPTLPIVADSSSGIGDNEMHKNRDERVRDLENAMRLVPAEYADKVRFCLAVSKGLRWPDGPLFCDQLFASCMFALAMAIHAQNVAAFGNIVNNLRGWAERSPICAGTNRADVIRAVNYITDIYSAENPEEPGQGGSNQGGFFGGLLGIFAKTRRANNVVKPLIKSVCDTLATVEEIKIMS